MATPDFAPISANAEVRSSMTTAPPEYNRPLKPGLLHCLPSAAPGQGAQAPGSGFAYTLAHQACQHLFFEDEPQRPGVELALALLASKRASLAERAPILGDVRVALRVLGLAASPVIPLSKGATFTGLVHSYAAQRNFVDSFSADELAG